MLHFAATIKHAVSLECVFQQYTIGLGHDVDTISDSVPKFCSLAATSKVLEISFNAIAIFRGGDPGCLVLKRHSGAKLKSHHKCNLQLCNIINSHN